MMLALTPFMRATRDELAQAARMFGDGDESAREWFIRAVRLRYPFDVAIDLLEEVEMNNAIMERVFQELLPVSPWAESLKAEARREGLEEGMREGKRQGERNATLSAIRTVVDSRFGGLEIPPAIRGTADPDALLGILKDLITANSRDEARAILTGRSHPPA